MLLAFANAAKYGIGATINPNGKIDDGIFEVIIFKNLSLVDIIKTFYKKLPIQSVSVESYRTNSVSVTCTKPIALQVDGEYIGEFKEVCALVKSSNLLMAIPQT